MAEGDTESKPFEPPKGAIVHPIRPDVAHNPEHKIEFGTRGIDIMAKEFPPLEEYVERLIVPGLTLLCAKPKVGKSWMLLDIGLAVAFGGAAFGTLRCQKAETLLLMLEDSERRLQSRMATLLRNGECPDGIFLNTRWPTGGASHERLKRCLDANPNIKLIAVDVLQKVKEQEQRHSSVYANDYQALEAYQQLAQERDVAIIISHHLRKADGEDPIDLVSGTLGVVGAADHVCVITGNAETGHKLTMRGRDLPDVSWDMELYYGQWTIRGETQKRKPLDKVDRIERNAEIKRLAAAGMSQREIVAQLKGTPHQCGLATVNDVLKGV